ncbi:DUF6702 family protein [Zhouia sp. PK063]|uniref:DUF6702 family protein n=1 Tax=Zhouia sp. PK063 TaxID=3373602 RepID=UPI0037B60AB8
MKKKLKYLLLISVFALFSFTTFHKFYLSVTLVNYSEEHQSFQITSRIFTDDLENALKQRYQINPKLESDKELPNIDEYIKKYILSKVRFKVNGEDVKVNFIGKKYDNDVVICYIEIPNINLKDIHQIEVQNDILFGVFEEQQNIVHFIINGDRHSFNLTQDNDKGMLNI